MLEHLISRLAASPENAKLVFMPVSRVLVESVCSIGDMLVAPPGEIDLDEFRPVPNKTLPESGSGITHFSGQDLRDLKTSMTGFGRDVLANMPLVAFTAKLDWGAFLSQDHESDVQLLRRLSAMAERAFDLVRLYFCCRTRCPAKWARGPALRGFLGL